MAKVRQHRSSGLARRDALLRAAVEVAAERGTAAVTHRAVTEKAGVPLPSVSYFFSSIDELAAEALAVFAEARTAELETLAEQLAASRVDPDEVAARFAEATVPQPPWPVAQFEVYLHAARSPELRNAVASALGAFERVAEAGLRAAGAPS